MVLKELSLDSALRNMRPRNGDLPCPNKNGACLAATSVRTGNGNGLGSVTIQVEQPLKGTVDQ
jgi:hypothetical protein